MRQGREKAWERWVHVCVTYNGGQLGLDLAGPIGRRCRRHLRIVPACEGEAGAFSHWLLSLLCWFNLGALSLVCLVHRLNALLGSRWTKVLEAGSCQRVQDHPLQVASEGSGDETRQDTSSICHGRGLTLNHSEPVLSYILSSLVFFYCIFKFTVCPCWPDSSLQCLFAEACIFVPIAVIFSSIIFILLFFSLVIFGVLFNLALHIFYLLAPVDTWAFVCSFPRVFAIVSGSYFTFGFSAPSIFIPAFCAFISSHCLLHRVHRVVFFFYFFESPIFFCFLAITCFAVRYSYCGLSTSSIRIPGELVKNVDLQPSL